MLTVLFVSLTVALLAFVVLDLLRYRSDTKWFQTLKKEIQPGLPVAEFQSYLEENKARLDIKGVQEHRDDKGFWGGKYPQWFTFPYRCTSSPVAPLLMETFGTGYKTHVAVCINRDGRVGEVMVLQD